MTDSRWEVVRLEELDPFGTTGGPTFRPLRRRLGVRAFGINCWSADTAADHVIERHREEDGPEEMYVVLEGRATFTVGGETYDAPVGTVVAAPPGTEREAVAAEPHTTVLAIGAPRDGTYEPLPWEDVYVADGLRRRGDIHGALRLMRALVERQPDQWQGFYNLACYQSVAGDREGALASLRRATELGGGDRLRELAPRDTDFATIRDDPRFAEALR